MIKESTILVVDDNISVRDFLKELITQNGYSVLDASDAEEALEILNRESIELVIADIKMPGLSGIDLLKQIKTNCEDIEVIMITGYQDISTAKEALHCGAYDYISKPIEDINKFMNIVDNALKGCCLRREREKLLTDLEHKNVQLKRTVNELTEKKQDLDSMVEDLDITLRITQKISRSIVRQESLDSLTPDMYKLFNCYAWGMMNVSQEFESLTRAELNIFLIYDLPEYKLNKIKENIERTYRKKYGELASINLNISSKNIIEESSDYKHDFQMNLPMISQNSVHGIAFVYSAEKEEFSEEKSHLFSIIVRQLATLGDANLLAKMKMLSITDELTGLYNRRGINRNLESEFNRRQHNKSYFFAFGIIDIDDFKRINDTYGHPAGDEVLKQIADIMERYSRCSDIMGRYGGEEFAFILPNTDSKGARVYGEKLRRIVAKKLFQIGEDKNEHITISVGIACLNNDSQIELSELVSRADKALYNAKNNGKNKTCIYDGSDSGICCVSQNSTAT